YTVSESGTNRVLNTNDLPMNYPTGNFPISSSDPAYQYDTNPNHIAAQNLSYTIALNPVAAAAPSCTSLGPIGVFSDGVVLFNALDASGRDAGAHETQDSCDGHPDGQAMYHYHDVSSCILNNAKGSSTLVGYALDGYGIYVERDSKGNLPTNADLDACHGRTSEVMWNGKMTDIYHYDATLEYPYTIGCFHGTPVAGRGTRA
ncbi:MAG: YHYH protein, partial [Candidatus Saccharimonadales bacterium]